MAELTDPECGCYAVKTEWRSEGDTYVHKGKPMIHYCPKHAAAPELYAALIKSAALIEDVFKHRGHIPEEIAENHKALAKARGENND